MTLDESTADSYIPLDRIKKLDDPADTTAVDKAYKVCYNDTKDVYVPKEETILQEAQRLVYGDRNASYGDFTVNMENTANIVNAVLGIKLKASDMAMIMVCVKLAREKNAFKRDTATDACGYLDGYVRCKEKGR